MPTEMPFTIGVEEEFLVVDAVTGALRPDRAATWRAARYGVAGELVDVEAGEALPAREALDRFLGRLRPSLGDLGDWDEVSSLVARVPAGGTGADRQRRILGESGDRRAVLDFIVGETDPAAC